MKKLAVFWFRRDLRLEDNVGLNAALEHGDSVLPLFIFDTNIIDELPKDDARISFIYQKLEAIDRELAVLGSGIKVYRGDPLKVWERIIKDYSIENVFYNRDYEPYALSRDEEIKKQLESKGINVHSFKDQVVFEGSEVLKDDGLPYTVYTPYKNRWLAKFGVEELKVLRLANETCFFSFESDFPTLESLGFQKSSIVVKDFHLGELENYGKERDFPALDSTSYLSPHLRFGTISARTVISTLKHGDKVFLSELIWREFFMQILYHFPHVVHRNFRAKYDKVAWRNNEREFKLWCEGKTGYPMVDAGMRQLNQTGYMHNRVRMITAGFLCKHLLIDWRWGEAYFARKLLDYDLSANNGNWQWAAGTGCDAAPYFRIFNPTTQIKKFDNKLEYIKQWVPEFESFEYAKPIVEHKLARERALKAYKEGIERA